MIFKAPQPGQKFFSYEVVQTSAMDCGPAALKSILEGFNIPVSYGRLREACQTDVDGTSIDTLEDIANQLGLRAEQVMLPVDHLILPEAEALPAIVVVRLPDGLTHFLVVWGRVGNFLQVMDPATGRRWPTWKQFQNEIYIHSFPVPADAWREWAGSEGMLAPLKQRMLNLELPAEKINELIQDALGDPGWRALGTLDAATRLIDALVRAGGITKGKEADKLLERFYSLNRSGETVALQPQASDHPGRDDGSGKVSVLLIPAAYWSVQPVPKAELAPSGASQEEIESLPEHLLLRGAVLVRILGPREKAELILAGEEAVPEGQKLPPDLQAALEEPTYRPEREVWNTLKQDGLLTPVILVSALLLATLGVLIQALLLQGIIRIGASLTTPSQRIAAVAILIAFLLAPLLLEFPINSAVLRMGRRLETRLRIAYLAKVQRLGDRYFRSRLTSDMTQRAHDLRQLRMLPNLGFSLLRTAFQLILTSIGVIWLDPISAPLAITGAIFFFALSFATRPILEEQDLRLRTHIGALSRFYLDALLGLVPTKTHGAERAMRRQHETQLYEWVRTSRAYFNLSSYVHSIGTLLYSVFSVLIVVNYISKGGQPGEMLLLFYWTLSLPTLAQTLANQVQQYPMLRNRIWRLLEPLGAPDEEDTWPQDGRVTAPRTGASISVETPEIEEAKNPLPVEIDLSEVVVQAGGHVILQDINLHIDPGEHVAIVGQSGAGKSSLVGLLLGWHRPTLGKIQVDSTPLDGKRILKLRRETAWVDPAVQLWNRSFFDNLRYGMEAFEGLPIGAVIQKADLFGVLERLPDGLKTTLGEGGGLVSGGEGQRVRLGRAMLRAETRLVVLDEPFGGLDREARRKLLVEARGYWQNVTLICITHDVSETLVFPRVLVMENGKIIEDGKPSELAAQPASRYHALLEAEQEVLKGLWEGAAWRRFKIEDGQLSSENGKQPVSLPGAGE